MGKGGVYIFYSLVMDKRLPISFFPGVFVLLIIAAS
jgi:hypothetical protein